MRTLKFATCIVAISVIASGQISAMEKGPEETENLEEIKCPILTSEIINANREAFPFPSKKIGGGIKIEGRVWQAYNATGTRKLGKEQPFVEAATQPDIVQNTVEPKITRKGGEKEVLCSLQYYLPTSSNRSEASVHLVYRKPIIRQPRSLKEQMIQKVQRLNKSEEELSTLPNDLRDEIK